MHMLSSSTTSLNRENTWVSPNDDYNGDIDIERLDIVTDAKIDAAVAKARKAYFQKLVRGNCIVVP